MASDTTASSPDSSTRRPNPHITVNSGSGGDLLQGFNVTNSESVELTRTVTAPGVTSTYPAPGPQRMLSSQSLRQNDGNLTSNPFSNPRTVYASRPFESSDMLLPPTKTRNGPVRAYSDVPSGISSRITSTMSSRRGSFDSEQHARNPFISHYDDSRAPSLAGSDDDNVNTQTVSEKYNITPSAGLLLYPEDIEKDDWLHNPSPDDKEDRCDIWNKRAMLNLGGLGFITFGVLFLFVGYPVLCVFTKFVALHHAYHFQDFCEATAWLVRWILRNRPELYIRDGASVEKSESGPDRSRYPVFSNDKNSERWYQTKPCGIYHRPYSSRLRLTLSSSPMSSIRMDALFTMETIHIFRQSISGMELHKIWSGTIRMQ